MKPSIEHAGSGLKERFGWEHRVVGLGLRGLRLTMHRVWVPGLRLRVGTWGLHVGRVCALWRLFRLDRYRHPYSSPEVQALY